MKKDTTLELMEVMFAVMRLMKGEMSPRDINQLSIMQVQALFFIHEHESRSMSDIANHFHIELPSATSLVDKLIKNELVSRNDDPNDRRLVRIILNQKGRTLLHQAMQERRKKMEKILSYLSEKEKQELFSIMKTLQTHLQK